MKGTLKEREMELTAGVNELNRLLGYHRSEIARLEGEKKQILSERTVVRERMHAAKMKQPSARMHNLKVSWLSGLCRCGHIQIFLIFLISGAGFCELGQISFVEYQESSTITHQQAIVGGALPLSHCPEHGNKNMGTRTESTSN